MLKTGIISVAMLYLLSFAIHAQSDRATENQRQKMDTRLQGAVPGTLNPSALKYIAGERCEIEYQGKWFGGVLVKAKSDDVFTVSWDGYSASQNSDVNKNRLRALTVIEGLPYLVVPVSGEAVYINGNLDKGKTIDLKWAEKSTMACFPASRFIEFEGNHNFYWMDLPENSELTVSVKSNNGERINMYGFSGFDGETLPPAVNSCVSCEAGYEMWSANNPPKDFQKSTVQQTISLRSTTNRYKVLVGVAGAQGVKSGDYTLSAVLKPYR